MKNRVKKGMLGLLVVGIASYVLLGNEPEKGIAATSEQYSTESSDSTSDTRTTSTSSDTTTKTNQTADTEETTGTKQADHDSTSDKQQSSTSSDVKRNPEKKSTFDDKTYRDELDSWMQKNRPHSAEELDSFMQALGGKMFLDSIKYGDSAAVKQAVGEYLLYDVAFVGDSLFSTLFTSQVPVVKNIPADAQGDFPETKTNTLDVLDPTTGGTREITSYYVDNHSNKTVVLHGGYRNSWSKGISTSQTRLFYQRGYNLLIVDNRATGKSEGKYITYGYYESDDVLSWVNQEINVHPKQQILLDGGSMGAATALSVLAKNYPENIKGIIEDCGFYSIRQELSYVYDQLIVASQNNPTIQMLLSLVNLNADNKENVLDQVNQLYANDWIKMDIASQLPMDGVKKSPIPKLFIHGTADTVVPADCAKLLYNQAVGYKKLVLIEGAGHGESLAKDSQTYTNEVDKFLTVVFKDKVVIRYQDEAGKAIAKEKELVGTYGDSFSLSAEDLSKEIKNYKIVSVQGAQSGKFSDKQQIVTVHYRKQTERQEPKQSDDRTGKAMVSNHEKKDSSQLLPQTGERIFDIRIGLLLFFGSFCLLKKYRRSTK